MLGRLSIVGIVSASLIVGLLLPSMAADKSAKPKVSRSAKSAAPQKDFLSELESRGKPQKANEEPPVYLTALSFVSKLALVIALAYLTILGLKRLTAIRGSAENAKRSIRVVESLAIGGNRTLHLVEAGTRLLLLASTPGHVSLITEFGPDEIEVHATEDSPVGFGDQLKAFLGVSPPFRQAWDGHEAAASVARMLRDFGSYLREKAADIGRLRGRHGCKDDQ